MHIQLHFLHKTKYSTLDPFFRIIKKLRAHQNMTNLFICQKQADYRKWLILSTHISHMDTNIAEKKGKYVTHEI